MEDLGPEKSYVSLLFYCEQIRLHKGLVSWSPSSSVSLSFLFTKRQLIMNMGFGF